MSSDDWLRDNRGSKKKPEGPRPTEPPQKIGGRFGKSEAAANAAMAERAAGWPETPKQKSLRLMDEDPESALRVQVATLHMAIEFLAISKEMLAVLKKVQWNMEFDGILCPDCKADKDGNQHWPPGHRDDCELGAVIKKAEEALAD